MQSRHSIIDVCCFAICLRCSGYKGCTFDFPAGVFDFAVPRNDFPVPEINFPVTQIRKFSPQGTVNTRAFHGWHPEFRLIRAQYLDRALTCAALWLVRQNFTLIQDTSRDAAPGRGGRVHSAGAIFFAKIKSKKEPGSILCANAGNGHLPAQQH